MENDWQHKPLPTLPQSAPGLGLGISVKMTGAIENIPRQRTTSSSTAGDLIRRVSNIFSSRRKRPPALKLARGGVSRIYESRNSSMQTLSESDEEDDIRRPSGLGSAVSISSLPPSPFSPSYPKDEPELAGPSYMPLGYVRGRATSTPNLLRSLSLRSRGSKRKGRPRNNSGISSGDGHDGNSSVQSHSYSHMRSTPSLQTHNQHQSQYQPQPTIITISSISVETIALILSHLSKSEIAQIAHTCQLFAEASRSALYTHIDLNELIPVQLEKLVALLASRRDFTDLVRTFSCSTWPRFFLPTTPIASPSSLSPLPISSRGISPSLHSSVFLDPHDHQPSSPDPETQHHITLLTATFTLSFQRMSNLTSLTLPTYDHDLLAHHTAFGLQQITFECDRLSREEVKELFAWLDGQINVKVLAFPRLALDCDFSLIKAGTTVGGTNVAEGSLKSGEGSRKVARPKTASGPLRQNSVGPPVGGGTKEGGREKKFMVAPFLVPLDSASSPRSSIISACKTPSPVSTEPSKPKRSASPTPRPRPQPLTKISPRPQSAAPSSPAFTTFAEAFANESQVLQMQAGASPSPSPSPSSSQIPFPTFSSKPTSTSTARTATATAATSGTAMTTSGYLPLSPLGSPTLLPNLTALCGPPSLIIALSTPLLPTANHVPISSSPSALSPSVNQRRPLQTISINITTTLFTGLRPTAIMHRLIGTTNVLKLYFGEHVDKRSVEKVFGAVGSSLGGVRDEQMGEGSDKRSEKKGEEWKGLVELHVGFAKGGPGSEEALHKMISSAIPRYPYLRVLELGYLPQGALVSHSHSHPPLSTNSPGHSPLPSPFIVTPTTPTTPTPTSNAIDGAKGGKPNGLPTPPRSVSPSLPPTSPSSNSVISSTMMTTPTVSVTPITPLGSSHRQSQLMEKRELSPPEQAYIRQWTKFCADLERVIFLSGAEWARSAGGK